jgi:hypothetical protein
MRRCSHKPRIRKRQKFHPQASTTVGTLASLDLRCFPSFLLCTCTYPRHMVSLALNCDVYSYVGLSRAGNRDAYVSQSPAKKHHSHWQLTLCVCCIFYIDHITSKQVPSSYSKHNKNNNNNSKVFHTYRVSNSAYHIQMMLASYLPGTLYCANKIIPSLAPPIFLMPFHPFVHRTHALLQKAARALPLHASIASIHHSPRASLFLSPAVSLR